MIHRYKKKLIFFFQFFSKHAPDLVAKQVLIDYCVYYDTITLLELTRYGSALCCGSI